MMSAHPVWLTPYAGLIAVSAFFGVAGLPIGFLRLTPYVAARLPFSSPAFGGVALAWVVGLPASLVAVLAW
jgi:hypothetical protein